MEVAGFDLIPKPLKSLIPARRLCFSFPRLFPRRLLARLLPVRVFSSTRSRGSHAAFRLVPWILPVSAYAWVPAAESRGGVRLGRARRDVVTSRAGLVPVRRVSGSVGVCDPFGACERAGLLRQARGGPGGCDPRRARGQGGAVLYRARQRSVVRVVTRAAVVPLWAARARHRSAVVGPLSTSVYHRFTPRRSHCPSHHCVVPHLALSRDVRQFGERLGRAFDQCCRCHPAQFAVQQVCELLPLRIGRSSWPLSCGQVVDEPLSGPPQCCCLRWVTRSIRLG